MELPRREVGPLAEGCPLFEDLLELPEVGDRVRGLLGRARAWRLPAGAVWEAPEAGRRGAYAVLSGRVALTREGEEGSTSIEGGQIFGQWTGLRQQPLAERVTAAEESVLLECDEELLEVALGPGARGRDQKFKAAFYRPLVLACPLFQDVPPDKLEEPIEKTLFAYREAGATLVREGEFGRTMFVLLRGRVRVERPAREQQVHTALERTPAGERYLEAGQSFGELGYITAQPRTATVLAAEDCLLMECPRLVVDKLKKLVKPLKDQIDASYREIAFRALMARSEVFRDVEPEALALLKQVVSLTTYEPYEPIFFQGDFAEALYVVQNGSVNVTYETPAGPMAIACLRPGDIFGEGALLGQTSVTPPSLATSEELTDREGRHGGTTTAVQYVDAARIPREAFDDLVATFPNVAERLRRTVRERQGQNWAGAQAGQARASQRWVMESQVTPGNHVLAVDLASCIRCGNCVTACQQTHDDGLSRFFWDQMRQDEALMPQVGISTSCQHCEYALCASACPTDAIERERESGAVFIDYEKCIQCGKCADPKQGCPYGSIHIVPASQVRRAVRNGGAAGMGLLARLGSLFRGGGPSAASGAEVPAAAKGPRKGDNYPVKCDLCVNQPFEACVHHCPTGAVFRFDGNAHLQEPLRQLGTEGGERAGEPWPLRFRAAFREPPVAKKPAVLELALGEGVEGHELPFERPEPGIRSVLANVFLTAPEALRVGGGPTRQLVVPVSGGVVTAEYQMTALAPGTHALRLSVYQGGFYLGTVPVEAEFAGGA